jgi:uncharacterized protein YkwD
MFPLVAVVLALLLVPAPAQASACADADLVPTHDTLQEVAVSAICLANEERAARALRPLQWHPGLHFPAMAYAERMVREGFFAHESPEGGTVADRLAAYRESGADVAENLAWGERELATARATVAGWMASEGHRANLLDPAMREVGIGVVPAGESATWVMTFGAPPPPPRATVRRVRCATKRLRAARRSAKLRACTRTSRR